MAAKSFTLSQIAWYRTMREAFALRGLDVDDLVAKSGMSVKPTDELDADYLSDLFTCVWERAVLETGDPSIGLTRLTHPVASFGMLAHMLLSVPDVLTAVQCIGRYAGMVSPTFAMDVAREGAHYVVTVTIAGGRRRVPMQRYDFLATAVLSGGEWITGKRLIPLRMQMPFSKPANAQIWDKAYGCSVEFEADAFRVAFSEVDMRTPIPTGDPAMAEMCARLSEAANQEFGDRFSCKVRQALGKLLSKGDPRREQVADMLCVSERTLQRRLSGEGTSFAELVDMVRREKAERLLALGRLSASEMAFELGFSDPSNFYRACKRWFGHTPGNLRMSS